MRRYEGSLQVNSGENNIEHWTKLYQLALFQNNQPGQGESTLRTNRTVRSYKTIDHML
jgi:hypothetical protein